jgi:hypothetical protein
VSAPIANLLETASSNPSRWINTAAFVAPAPFTFGTLGRNFLSAQPYRNVDVSLFRGLSIRDKIKLQLRIEAFNALNMTTFRHPRDINFGRIFSTRSVERQVQIGLKLQY